MAKPSTDALPRAACARDGAGHGTLCPMDVAGVLGAVWSDVVSRQPAPGAGMVWASAALALGLVVVPVAWRVVRHLLTIAHEGCHALVALLCGRRLAGIRVHSDTSGLTVSHGKPTGPGMVLTAFAGYAGPPVLGLGAAYLLVHGHALAVLWLAVLLLLLLLLQIRNLYGLYAVLVAGGLTLAVSGWAGERWQSFAAYTGTWFLLLASIRPVQELQRARGEGVRSSDADVLAALTRVPAVVWVTVFYVLSIGCVLGGGRWLLGW